jgi:uncharacterized protein YifN (PemK superfamily)
VPIRYHPHPGDVLFCHFPEPGTYEHAPPEMVKRRRVVLLSQRFRHDPPSTLLVVPLSATPPNPIEPYHYKLAERYAFLTAPESWVKGNMIAHVALTRLYPIFSRGQPINARLTDADFQAVRRVIARALGLTAADMMLQ